MSQTFFFYDLETSGLSPRQDRIMQFAGQRTDMDLNPVGEPINILVKLNDDTLPSPGAVLITGITPQATQADGYTEAEFAKLLYDQVFTPDTIALGFNNIRFDDEFIRHLFWRNFYDPYEWSYKDGRSRWDLLDLVRMTRALRPDGIKWPADEDGKPNNRLEELAKVNDLVHTKAHDALSDVEASISVARLIRQKQPQLFDYLFKIRSKNEVKQLVNLDDKQPFVYVSGSLDTEHNKTTVAFPLTAGRNANVVIYDLRYDPAAYSHLNQEQIYKCLFGLKKDLDSDNLERLPIKELQYNRAPAVAPLSVLDSGGGWSKIALDKKTIEKHQQALLALPEFAENVRSVFESRPEYEPATDPEAGLYDGFLNDKDRLRAESVRQKTAQDLADFNPQFDDERLPELLLHYKARSFPKSLTKDETGAWEAWRSGRLQSSLPGFIKELQTLAAVKTSDSDLFLLQELQLWAESIAPIEAN